MAAAVSAAAQGEVGLGLQDNGEDLQQVDSPTSLEGAEDTVAEDTTAKAEDSDVDEAKQAREDKEPLVDSKHKFSKQERLGHLSLWLVLGLMVLWGLPTLWTRVRSSFEAGYTTSANIVSQELRDGLSVRVSRSLHGASLVLDVSHASYLAGDFPQVAGGGRLSDSAAHDLELHFASVLGHFPVSNAYVITGSGSMVGAFRDSDGALTFKATNDTGCLQTFGAVVQPGDTFLSRNSTALEAGTSCSFDAVALMASLIRGHVPDVRAKWLDVSMLTSFDMGFTKAQPVYDSSGQISAVFAVDVTLRSLNKHVTSLTSLPFMPQGSIAYLANRNGTFLSVDRSPYPASLHDDSLIRQSAPFTSTLTAKPLGLTEKGEYVVSSGAVYLSPELQLVVVAVLPVLEPRAVLRALDSLTIACIAVAVLVLLALARIIFMLRPYTYDDVKIIKQGDSALGKRTRAHAKKNERRAATSRVKRFFGRMGLGRSLDTKTQLRPENGDFHEYQRLRNESKQQRTFGHMFPWLLMVLVTLFMVIAGAWNGMTFRALNENTKRILQVKLDRLQGEVSGLLQTAQFAARATLDRHERGAIRLPLFANWTAPSKMGGAVASSADLDEAQRLDKWFLALMELRGGKGGLAFDSVFIGTSTGVFLGAAVTSNDGSNPTFQLSAQDPLSECKRDFPVAYDVQRNTLGRDYASPLTTPTCCDFNPTQQSWYQGASSQWTNSTTQNPAHWSVRPTSVDGGALKMTVANALTTPHGVEAVVAAEIPLALLGDFLKDVKLGTTENARTFIVQRNPEPAERYGLLLASSDSDVANFDEAQQLYLMLAAVESEDDTVRNAARYLQSSAVNGYHQIQDQEVFTRRLDQPLTAAAALEFEGLDWLLVATGDRKDFYGLYEAESAFIVTTVAGGLAIILILASKGFGYIREGALGAYKQQARYNTLLDQVGSLHRHVGGVEIDTFYKSPELCIVRNVANEAFRRHCVENSLTPEQIEQKRSEFLLARAQNVLKTAKKYNIITHALLEMKDGPAKLPTRLYALYKNPWVRQVPLGCGVLLLGAFFWEPPSNAHLAKAKGLPPGLWLLEFLLLLPLLAQHALRLLIGYWYETRVFDPAKFLNQQHWNERHTVGRKDTRKDSEQVELKDDDDLQYSYSEVLGAKPELHGEDGSPRTYINVLEEPWKMTRDKVISALLLALLLDLMLKETIYFSFEYYVPLRALLVLAVSTQVLFSFQHFVFGVWEAREVILLFVCMMLVSGCFSFHMFSDVEEMSPDSPGKSSYKSFSWAVTSSFIFLSTGENYTELVYPAFVSNPLTSIFFIVLTFTGMFVVLAMVISEFEKSFDARRARQLKQLVQRWRISFLAASQMLDTDSDGKVNRRDLGRFLAHVRLEEKGKIKRFRGIRHKTEAAYETSLARMEGELHVLFGWIEDDKPKKGKELEGPFSVEEFLNCVEALDAHPLMFELGSEGRAGEQLWLLLRDETLFKLRRNEWKLADAQQRELCATADLKLDIKSVQKFTHKSLIDNIAIFIVCLEVWLASLYSLWDNRSYEIDVVNGVCLALQVAEIIYKVAVLGPRAYWWLASYKEYQYLHRVQAKEFQHRFDLIFVFLPCLVLFGLVLAPDFYMFRSIPTEALYRGALSIPIVRMFSLIPIIQSITFVCLKVMKQFLSLGGLFFLIYFVYGVYGMLLFQGETLVYKEDSFEPIESSFDTLGKSFLTLFQLMVGEAWHEVMFAAILASSYSRCYYFMSFIFVVTLLFCNLLVGMILSSIRSLYGKDFLSSRIMLYAALREDEIREDTQQEVEVAQAEEAEEAGEAEGAEKEEDLG